MKTIVLIGAVLWAVVVTYFWYSASHSTATRGPAAQTEFTVTASESTTATDALRSQNAELRAEIARLQKELAAARTEQMNAASSILDASHPTAPTLNQQEKQIPNSDLQRLTRIYGPFLKTLSLDDVSKLSVLQALQLDVAGVPPENAELKKLLSAEDYARWQEYRPSHIAVENFEQSAGLNLTEEQRNRLAETFAQAGLTEHDRAEVNITPGQTASQLVESELDQTYTNWDRLMASAKDFLTPDQFNKLDNYMGARALEREYLMKHLQIQVENAISFNKVTNEKVKIINMSSEKVDK